jgi:hypothetical protein
MPAQGLAAWFPEKRMSTRRAEQADHTITRGMRKTDGPIFVTADGRRLDRHGAGRIVRRIARQAGIGKPVGPEAVGRHPPGLAGRIGADITDSDAKAPREPPICTAFTLIIFNWLTNIAACWYLLWPNSNI